ncbi:MAG TPA: peptidoglycan editing factor PgeF [Ktedonobacteraceae bacterium]|nr:peptidoglycan editing factor PgeF [Ktedonobacteraceae bacterium]
MIEQQQGTVSFLQFSSFQVFPNIIHAIFTRRGGRSSDPYSGLNVSFSTGDSQENVLGNRLLALQALGIASYPCATVWQIHSAQVAMLDTQQTSWDDWRFDWPHRSYWLDGQELVWTIKPRRKADAIITRQRGIALALSFADCVPLLLYDPVRQAIALAHAGWRGTARGIALAAVEAMREQFSSRPQDIYAGICPSIGPCCYEVSEYVRDLFSGRASFSEMPAAERYRPLVREAATFLTRYLPQGESLRLDLWQTNYNQLLLAGLLPAHIEASNLCTGCHTDQFFSHRMEQGRTGRFPVIFALSAGTDPNMSFPASAQNDI